MELGILKETIGNLRKVYKFLGYVPKTLNLDTSTERGKNVYTNITQN